jgi:hypothetical protein
MSVVNDPDFWKWQHVVTMCLSDLLENYNLSYKSQVCGQAATAFMEDLGFIMLNRASFFF